MTESPTLIASTPLASRFLAARLALSAEAVDGLDKMAALAVQASAAGDLPLAAAAAGATVLVEHLQAAHYRHAPRMLAVLGSAGPGAAAHGSDALLAWAGAAVAHDYGVLPGWPAPDIEALMARAEQAPSDIVLALGCGLGEVCERNGEDSRFAALAARLAAFEAQPGVSPFWRGHWAIVSAWHLVSFGKTAPALERLAAAMALADQHQLHGLAAVSALQRARLIEADRDPLHALALAGMAAAHGDAARTPLWWGDAADVDCRIALAAGDFHAAVGHARRARGHVQAGGVWPGYLATYLKNEAHALLGAGAYDEALLRYDEMDALPLPAYLSARVGCLRGIAALIIVSRSGRWQARHNAELAAAMARLRQLEWTHVFSVLPAHIADLFGRALRAGIETEWIRAAIRSRELAAPDDAPENWPWRVKVRVFGAFEVSSENTSPAFAAREPRKAASKPMELLRLLAAQGHASVPVGSVAEALWPGDGREGRQKAFEVTVVRLRRLLGVDAAVQVSERRVRLNRQCVWLDAQALGQCLLQADNAPDAAARTSALDAALAVYLGPCLADSGEAWALAAREHWRGRLGATLLRAQRDAAMPPAHLREYRLRACAADPALAALLGVPGSAG